MEKCVHLIYILNLKYLKIVKITVFGILLSLVLWKFTDISEVLTASMIRAIYHHPGDIGCKHL
jgi:hypothetical protein